MIERGDLFEMEIPAEHEAAIKDAAQTEFALVRRSRRRAWLVSLSAGFGALATAGLAVLFFRRPPFEDGLGLAEEVEATGLEPDLFAELPLLEAADFETLMEDLDAIESEDV